MPDRVQLKNKNGLVNDFFVDDSFSPTSEDLNEIQDKFSWEQTFKDLGNRISSDPVGLFKDIGLEAEKSLKPISQPGRGFLDEMGAAWNVNPIKNLIFPPGITELGNKIGTLPGFRSLAEDFPKAQKAAESVADVIGGDVQGKAGELPAWYGLTPSATEAGIRGFGAGLVEEPLKHISTVDLAPFGRAAKFAAGGAELLPKAAKVLEFAAKGLQGVERVSGGMQGLQSAAQIPAGIEDIQQGNTTEGAIQALTGGVSAALGARSTLANFLTPELVAKGKKGINDLGSGKITSESMELLSLLGGAGSYTGVDLGSLPLAGGILSHGRYTHPGEKPTDVPLTDAYKSPFDTIDKQVAANESVQDLMDVLKRVEDVTKRRLPNVIPEAGEAKLKDISFDPGFGSKSRFRGANAGGDISINPEAIAKKSVDLEDMLRKGARTVGHELIHEDVNARPHGIAIPEVRGLGFENLPEGVLEHSKPEGAYTDLEGQFLEDPTNRDFGFRTADESLQNATQGPIEDIISKYLSNPNDKGTLEHAREVLLGNRGPKSDYRDFIPEEDVSLGKIEDLPRPKPIEAYHGTEKEFDKLDPTKEQTISPYDKQHLEEDLPGGETTSSIDREMNRITKEATSLDPLEKLRQEYDALEKDLSEELDPYTPEWNKRFKRQQEVWKSMQALGEKPFFPADFKPQKGEAPPKPEESLSEIRYANYNGQEVEIIGRVGNSVHIIEPDGTRRIVQKSELSKSSSAKNPVEAKSKEVYAPETLDPEDVALVAEPLPDLDPKALEAEKVDQPLEDFPDVQKQRKIDKAFEDSIRKKQEQERSENRTAQELEKQILKEQKKEKKTVETPVEEEGIDTEDWLKTAAKEVPKIEKAQASEIIKDQPFRDQIIQQDKILKAQEQEALKAGKAEEASKVAMERKIFRAQNAEEFQKYREEQKARQKGIKESVKSVTEAEKLAAKIETEQKKEAEGKSPIDDAANHFIREHESKKPSSPSDWLFEASNFIKSFRFAGDLGVPLRNARPAYLSNPIQGAKFVGKSVQAAFSSKQAKTLEQGIGARPNFKREIVNGKLEPSIAEKAGLKFHTPGFDPSAEYHGSYYAPKIPILGKVAAGSERAAQASTNLMRAYLFDKLTEHYGDFNKSRSGYEAAAKAANLLTGRGEGTKGGKLEAAMPLLNVATSSARMTLAKYQRAGMTAKSLYDSKIPANVRSEYLKAMGAGISTGVAALGLASALGADVDLDEQSPTFLQAKFGKKVWPVFGSSTPDVVRLLQTVIGRKGKDGQIKSGPRVYTDLFLNPDSGSGRASPLLSEGFKALAPGNYAQMNESRLANFLELPEVPTKAMGLLEPMSVGTTFDLFKDSGLEAFPPAALGLLGENISVWNDPRFKEKSKKKESSY